MTLKVVAMETSVVDLHYPKDGGNDALKHAFISALPRLVKEAGVQAQAFVKDAPRKGDMVTVSAEALDAICTLFAQQQGMATQEPEAVRKFLFGAPVPHAGGSLANTFDAMIYSEIDGKKIFDGTFVCTAGKDAAGAYFAQSFDGHVAAFAHGRQMVSHIIPIDGDRIMITAPSFAESSDEYCYADDLKDDPKLAKALAEADVVMVGGYLEYAGNLRRVLGAATDAVKMRAPEDNVRFVFTLAAQGIAEKVTKTVLQPVGNMVVHGNTGEFRRHNETDHDWRQRFAGAFVDKDGNPLMGREEETAKNANADYINAKQAANDSASAEAHNRAKALTDASVAYVVTNGGRPARVVTGQAITMLPNTMIDKAKIKSTVGAGDNHVAGYWVGKALGMDEAGCLSMAGAFARAVIQIPEARLPRDAVYTSKSGRVFRGPIAALDHATLDRL